MGILNKFIVISLLSLSPFFANAETKSIEDSFLRGLKTTDGAAFAENQEPKKLVYFWATWCPSCRQKFQNGDLAKIDQAKGVELLAVNTDKELERAKNFLAKAKPGFKVVRDDTKALTNALGANVAPFWAVLERDPQTKAWKVLVAEEGADVEKMHKVLGI
jgi:thiol-disulfide isomerase/thioredoxin